ncbi:MAG: SRPBCC family protein [Burkholderiales bacterium]
MEMTGEQLIPLAQNDVWRGLNDPEILKSCIAGCEAVEKTAENEYRIALTASVGPVKAKFSGKLSLSDLDPPNSYSIAFEGSGGAAGFAKGGAQVKLSTEGSATRLNYSAKANIGGKLAQIGSRLVDGVAQKMANDFFVKFNDVMGKSGAAAPAADAASGTADKQPTEEPFNPIWIVGGTLVVMLFFWWAMGGAK